jgi:hypothetical protein
LTRLPSALLQTDQAIRMNSIETVGPKVTFAADYPQGAATVHSHFWLETRINTGA